MRISTTLIVAVIANLCACKDSDANLPDTVQLLLYQKDKSCPNQPQYTRGSDDQLNMKNDTTQKANRETGPGRQWCTPDTKVWVMVLDYDVYNVPRGPPPDRFGKGNPIILDLLMGATDLVESTLAGTANGAIIREDGVIHRDRQWDDRLYSELGWQFKMSPPGPAIKVYNRQPYQLTYGVLGAGLRGARDFMRLSNATTDGWIYIADGENVVGFMNVTA